MTTLLSGLSITGLVVAAYLYWQAFRRCRKAGHGPVTPMRLASFALGTGLVVAALLSPLEIAAERSLAAHMLQHVMLLVAPLPLLAARTGTALLLGLDPALRSRLSAPLHRLGGRLGAMRARPSAWTLLAVTLAGWHMPAAFQAAALSPLVHAAQHALFLGTAALWWLSLIGTGRRRSRAYGASLLSVFGTMLLGTAVGALLTFSARPWYPLYAARVEAAGGDWLADQQLAGLIMWIPPGVVLLAVFVWLAAEWLRSVEGSRPRSATT